MLDKFRLANFKVDVVTENELILPEYKGSTIRGIFGHAFKRVACIKSSSENCSDCSLKERCPYNYVFNTPVPADAEIMRKYNYAPHPYILCPPLESTQSYPPGAKIHYSITIIGDALNFLPYFVLSFEVMGKLGLGKNKGKYQLKSISALSKKETWQEIYNSANQQLMNNYPIFQINDLEIAKPVELLTVRFLTPVRIKYEGKIVGDKASDSKRLEFHILMRNLLRRIGLLSYFHCGEELNIDYRHMIDEAQSIKITEEKLEWYDWGRYSQRQEQGIGMGGLIGEISYEGKIKDFLPFIRIGEFVHVGKSTAFGMGRYCIV